MKITEAEIFDIRFDPSVSPTSAIQMGKRLEEPRPFFYEEPVDAMNVECMKKVAAHAETYDLHMQPHNSGGVVATACAVQLDCCILNFIIQEWFPYHGEDLYRLVDRALEPQLVDGYLPVPRDPQLRIELDAAAAARQSCVRVR
jgi:L-alanine-DL-glutamate epimerase-like enolase superfamily enzyme